jgi:hypothetical protein
MGIAQFMPDVADRMGLGDAFDARDALPASGQLLRSLRRASTISGWCAAAYNAGPKRVADWLEQRSELPRRRATTSTSSPGGRPSSGAASRPRRWCYNVPRQCPVPPQRGVRIGEQSEREEQARLVAEESGSGAGARGARRSRSAAPSAGSAAPDQEGQAGALHRGEPRPVE